MIYGKDYLPSKYVSNYDIDKIVSKFLADFDLEANEFFIKFFLS